MHSRHFEHAADSWSNKKRRLEGRARGTKSHSSRSKFQDQQYEEDHLRDLVEGQFMRMNDAHDRIRDQFLGKTCKFR